MAEPASGSRLSLLDLDALMVKIRDQGHIVTKVVYLAIGVNLSSPEEILGLKLEDNCRG